MIVLLIKTGCILTWLDYKSNVKSLLLASLNLVSPPRIEQGSSDFQSVAMTTSAKAA